MSEQTKTVVCEYRDWIGAGRRRERTVETITYPAECSLHFDTNQQTLRIKTRTGEDIAMFREVSRYTTEGVEVSKPVVVSTAAEDEQP